MANACTILQSTARIVQITTKYQDNSKKSVRLAHQGRGRRTAADDQCQDQSSFE